MNSAKFLQNGTTLNFSRKNVQKRTCGHKWVNAHRMASKRLTDIPFGPPSVNVLERTFHDKELLTKFQSKRLWMLAVTEG